jgi:hypothetical protein
MCRNGLLIHSPYCFPPSHTAFELACSDLTSAAQLDPQRAGNYFLRGTCHNKLREFKEVPACSCVLLSILSVCLSIYLSTSLSTSLSSSQSVSLSLLSVSLSCLSNLSASILASPSIIHSLILLRVDY